MGMSIGVSFAVAFSLGPWLTGFSGDFRIILGNDHHGFGSDFRCYFWCPKSPAIIVIINKVIWLSFKQVLKMGDLNRLHVSVFSLHLLLTAMFIYVHRNFIDFAKIPLNSHGWVYFTAVGN